MELMFYVRKVLGTLLLPPNGPLIVAVAGMLLTNRHPKVGRALAWFGLTTLLLLSVPVVSNFLLKMLDDHGPLDYAVAQTAQAIVIPGGGIRTGALEYDGDTVGRLTLERVRYGAWVARHTGLPVLVSGGIVYGGTAEAPLMTKALVQEFGVAVRWMESTSRNTHENAQRSADMLRTDGVHRVILVAHAFDMRRARAEFEAAGLQVIPAPTMLANLTYAGPGDLVPSARAMLQSYFALYELLANAAWRIGL